MLSAIAQQLSLNGWSVKEVFGQPPELVQTVQYEGELIKVISPEMFLARIYQVELTDLSQLQVACLMKVLGKPELNDAVRYDELELLMENFGVAKT